MMIALASGCAACTYVTPLTSLVRVGPDFQVDVKDRGLPVKGLRLEIGSQRLGNSVDIEHFQACQ